MESGGAAAGWGGIPGGRAARAACALLFLSVAALYSPTFGYPFVNYDDNFYVWDNPLVRCGLTLDGALASFRTPVACHWQPLTLMSHMLDVTLFGLDAGWHHAVNVLLHGGNAVLVFLVLRLATGAFWPSLLAAALFALHPLRVESVAWVSERKDVLSAFFGLLSLLAYTRYGRGGRERRWYLLSLGAYALSLLSKPTLVTLPFALLLWDWWPLGRSGELRRALAEKVPFLLLAAASSVTTYLVMDATGGVPPAGYFPLSARLSNVAWSYAAYLGKAAWPAGLAVIYPHPWILGGKPLWQVLGAAALLSALTALSFRERGRRPFLLAGWLWYLGTLFPVSGIVPAGAQGMDDRYTYIPAIGLSWALAFALAPLLDRPAGRRAVAAGALAALAALSAATSLQVSRWRSSVELFRHAVAVTEDNFVARFNLGVALGMEGRTGEAVAEYREAIRIYPPYYQAHLNLGYLLLKGGDGAGARLHLEEALRLRPGDPAASSYLRALSSPPG